MAYTNSFDHDVFISYAHSDNQLDGNGDDTGWVTRFEQQLSARLHKYMGKPPAIWRDDRQLKRSQLFDAEIEKNVNGAGVMIALISPSYLHSDYCEQELQWFGEKTQSDPFGLQVENQSRIFPVRLYNIPFDEWPSHCQGTSGFNFFRGEGKTLGRPLAPSSPEFEDEIYRLIEELRTILTQIQNREVETERQREAKIEWQRAAEPTLSPHPTEDKDEDEAPSFTVFISSAADDLRPIRRKLKADLKREGIAVVDDPPDDDEDSHQKAVIDAVSQVDLCVNLLSTQPGEPLDPDDPDKTFPTFPTQETRLGLEHGRSQLILLPEEFRIDDIDKEAQAYREFIEELRNEKRDADKWELISNSRSA